MARAPLARSRTLSSAVTMSLHHLHALAGVDVEVRLHVEQRRHEIAGDDACRAHTGDEKIDEEGDGTELPIATAAGDRADFEIDGAVGRQRVDKSETRRRARAGAVGRTHDDAPAGKRPDR